MDCGEIVVDTDGTFEEEPVCILDSRDQVFQRRSGEGNVGVRGHDESHLSFLI